MFSLNRPDPCVVLDRIAPIAPNHRLPRIIHQQWKTEVVPPKYMRWRDRTRVALPNHEYMLWTDTMMEDLIANHYPNFLDTYRSLSHHIMRVDAARYFILHKYGGLYLDMDYEALVDFWDRLPDNGPAIIQSYSHYLEGTQNSLMSSPPGHALWPIAWDVIDERLRSGSRDPIYVTGPKMMDEAIRIYTTTSSPSHSNRIRILPCENWQRVTWGDERSAIHTLWKAFAYYTGIFKDCGDVLDSRCQLGIHHGTTMWY
jgi:mannosyltransferase OCH1-like enzyme